MSASYSEVIIRYSLKKESLTTVIAANNQLKASLQSIGREAVKTTSTVQTALSPRATSGLATGMKTARTSIREAREEADDLRDSLEGAGRAAKEVRTPSPTSGARESFDRRETAGERASALLGALPGGEAFSQFSSFAADVNAAGKAALDSGVGMKLLATAGLASTAAVIGVALALQNFNAVTEQSRQNLSAALSAQEAYYQAVATLDEQGARDRIAELERGLEAQQQFAAEAREAADSAFQQLANSEVAGFRVGEDAARAFFAVDATAQALVTTANEAETQLGAMEQEVTRLNQGLDAGVFAANEQTDAQSQLATATNAASQAILASINGRVARETEYYRLSQTGTADAIQARIDENAIRLEQLETERAALQVLADNRQDVSVNMSELGQQMTALQQDTYRLSNGILQSAQARETEAAAARDSEQAARERGQALTQIANLERSLAETAVNEARQDARNDRDFRRQRLQEDIAFQQQLAEKEKEFHESQLDLIEQSKEADAEARSDAIDAEKDFSKSEIARTKAFEEKLADIRARANADVGEAAGELDAKRVDAALRAKEQELADAVKENDKQADENTQAREERLANIEAERRDTLAALAQKLADNRAAYEQQRTADIAAFNDRRRVQDEERSIRRQDELQDRALRRQAQNQQIADLQAQINAEKNIRKAGLAGALSDFQAFFNAVRNASKSTGGFNAGGVGNKPPANAPKPPAAKPPTSKPPLKKFRLGGDPPLGERVLVGKNDDEMAIFTQPATIYPNQNMTMAGGGNTISNVFHITGGNPQEIADAVAVRLHQVVGKLNSK